MIARRALLSGACACAALAACGRRGGGDTDRAGGVDTGAPDTGVPDETDGTDTSDTDDTDDRACTDTGGAVEGWVEVPLAGFPELATVGGYAYVDVPDALLHLIVAQLEPDCFVALWRICTHGACETEWDPATREATCPCHGSIFAEDGAVLLGPATRGLRVFPVVRRGESLWIER